MSVPRCLPAVSFLNDPDPEGRRALLLLAPLLVAALALEWAGGGTLHFPLRAYLGIHTAFELVALTLGLLCFGLLWLAPATALRTSTVALASTVAAAAVLDLLHMLSYAGMPDLVTPAGPEKAIGFWLVGRTSVSLGLLVAAWAPARHVERRATRYLWLAGTLGLAALASWLILMRSDWLPRTVTPGQGLSNFKVGCELGLAALNLLAAARLTWMARTEGWPAITLAAAAVFSALAEFCFARYGSPSDLLNGLGHVAKVLCYAYLARTAYLLVLRQPLARAGGLADALTASISPTLICSEQGVIGWVNPAFTQATGHRLEDLDGQGLQRLQVDGDEALWASLRSAMALGQPWQGHVRMRRQDGSAYLDDRHLTPIRDVHGHLNGYVMTGDDITERDRRARALAAGEERMRALLASAPDAVVAIDSAGTMQLVNRAAEALFGHSRAEMIGQNVRMLMPAAEAALHDGHLRRYAETGERRVIGKGRDVVGRHRDGQQFPLHLTVGEARLPDGHVFIGFLRDIREQHLARQALEEREQRYRALMDTAMDGVCICDLAGRFIAVNDAYVRLSGYTREELLGLSCVDMQAELDAAGMAERVAEVVRRGHMQYETRYRRKDGSTWPAEISAACWGVGAGAQGSAEGAAAREGQLFVFVRDLRPRKADERALRESEERLALALRGTNDGLWDYNLHEQALYLSPRWKEMLGYRDDELPSSIAQVRHLLHPDDALAGQGVVADLLAGQGGDRFETELRLRHRDGHWVPVLSRGQLVRDEDGHPLRLIGTHQDLTERRQAEQALRESENKLRTLFELSPLGIALCTMDGRLVEFNEAYRILLGYDAAALRSLSYWDLTPTEYAQSEAEQLQVVAHTGRYGPYEKEYLRIDGRRVPVRLNGVRIELGGQHYLWSIVEDLTVQRRIDAERQALQQQQMQSQKLEALGQLTGGIAHDFNNMLAGIMGLASLGLERHVDDADGKLAQYLREIVRTSERGRDLVAKMLAYVRTGDPAPSQATALGPVVGEICDLLRSSLPATMALDVWVGEAVPPVCLSAVDTHQIVMNLVLNARDAIGQHGRIRVGLGLENLAPAVTCNNCHQRVAGPRVVLEVRDDGPGIPPEVLPKIFDPFFTTKEVGRGTGLGLASVIGLVHRAGGHIQVLTPPGGGTVMRVLLPPVAGAAPPKAEPAAAVALQAGGAVWVVDDDPAVRVFLTELLREHGFQAHAFSDPRQALASLRATLAQPDVRPVALITDQTMPGLTGTELAQAVLALLPGLPVVLCSGYSEPIDADAVRALGVRCFLRKPFDSQELLAALADVLPASAEPVHPLDG